MNVNGSVERKRNGIILVFNAGSSSLKFTVYDAVGGRVACRGQFDYDLSDRVTRCYESDDLGKKEDILEYVELSRKESVCRVIERVRSFGRLIAVGHRVVHGRDRKDHTLVTEDILSELGGNIPLAPLHQPHNLHPIQILRVVYPDMPQVACFDTAFHWKSSMCGYALPAIFEYKYGIKRYGFHGLSYQFVSQCDLLENQEKTVVCHLGSGASLCWMRFNRETMKYESVGCTLGYSTMDGIITRTRIGSIDPGVVLHMVSNAHSWGLVREGETNVAAVERILLTESGLRGVSGVTGDMATLLDIFTGRESAEPCVRQSVQKAIQMFVRCVASEIARATVDLGGLDQIVFTAGIGENAWRIRRYVCDRLEQSIFSSLRLDETLNARCVGGTMGHISREDSGLRILVVPTDENSVIFEATRRIAGLSRE